MLPAYSVQLGAMQEENERLQAKIDGLKQEYEKIGLQVFHAFKESFFTNLEDFLAKRRLVSNEPASGREFCSRRPP